MSENKGHGRAGRHLWVINCEVLCVGASLSEASSWNGVQTYVGSHETLWAEYQRANRVPSNMGWQDAPRGRVSYNPAARQFHLVADRCILNDEKMLSEIRRWLFLPPDVVYEADSHYQCAACRRKS
jgi:hypothetical protein